MSNMQLDTLRRIVQEVNASVSLHESLDIMVNQVAEAMKVDVCSIYLLDERNQRYVLMASKGLNPESVGHVSCNSVRAWLVWSGNAKKSLTLTMRQNMSGSCIYLKQAKKFITLSSAYQSCIVVRLWAFWLSKINFLKILVKLPSPFSYAVCSAFWRYCSCSCSG